jgi:hypothetical protein
MPKPLPYGLKVQLLTNAEIPSVADLLSKNIDDGGLYQYPDWYSHGEAITSFYIKTLRRWVRKRTVLIRVAIIPDNGKTKVVGFSMWNRLTVEKGSEQTEDAEMWHASFLDRYVS